MATDHDVTGEISPAPKDVPPERPRKRRFVIWAAVLCLFVGLLWWAMHLGPSNPTRNAAMAPGASIQTATAVRGDLPIYIDAIGTVTSIYTTSISSQVTGRVVAVHYQEGQLVRVGTPLIDIDPRPSAATLLQAQGTLERDLQVLAQARMDLERFRAAWARRAIAKQQLDDQEKLALQTEGTVKLDRGVVEFDTVQLDYCHITSPITGRVGLRLVDPGNLVVANAGTVLAVVTQLQPISVVFAISEDQLGEVLAQPEHGDGLPVQLFDRTKSKSLATGTLITIDNQIDTTTGTVRLRATFDNANEALFPNQFVNARLEVSTVRDATEVPSSALQRNGDVTFVYTIVGGHAHVQRVTPGVVAGDKTQVTGIAPGTIVANSSFEKLRDNAPVVIAPEAGSAHP
jgi:membrane fusion protein, multidrug efflux system